MNRIKIPGSLKAKKILLAVLVLASIAIVIQFAHENRKSNVNKEISREEEIITTEDSNITEIDETKISEEESLYKDAYDTFFQGDYKGASAKADTLINKYPESFKGYTIRGIAKGFAGSYEEGMNDIDKALKINPDYGYARYNKALNYELYGHYDEAITWYNKALDIEEYMWSYYGIASIYGRKGDTQNVLKYLKEAVRVENVKDGKSAIKEEAKTEKDFDPVRDNKEFKEFINN